MGFFSWKTQNTSKSIANTYSRRFTFPVVMIDNKGNEWLERNYEGYGVFGGKDFYELLAEMNGLTTREGGLKLAFSGDKYISPNLYEKMGENDVFNWIDTPPENCEFQGYFYNN